MPNSKGEQGQSSKWTQTWSIRLAKAIAELPTDFQTQMHIEHRIIVPRKVSQVLVKSEGSNGPIVGTIPFYGRPPTVENLSTIVRKYVDDYQDQAKSDTVGSFTGKVHNIDCIKLLNSLPNESIQTIFADPPFNVNKNYSSYDDNLTDEEYWNWTTEWLHECFRVLRSDGSFFLYNIPRHLIKAVGLLNNLADFQHWIAWNSVGKPLGSTLQLSHYGILYYAKNSHNLKFYDVRAPHKSCRVCNSFLKDYGGKEHLRHEFGTLIGDVWDDIHRVRHASKRIKNHPCQLPTHLIERILLMSTDENDVVFDPFCGGGSMAVAAKQLGRRYIGAELDPEYTQISNVKYSEATPTKANGVYVSKHLNNVVSLRDIDLIQMQTL